MNNKYYKNLIVLSIVTGFLISLNTTNSNLLMGAESQENSFISKMGSKGTDDGQFMELEDIEIDSSDIVYVSDRGTFSIQSFTKIR